MFMDPAALGVEPVENIEMELEQSEVEGGSKMDDFSPVANRRTSGERRPKMMAPPSTAPPRDAGSRSRTGQILPPARNLEPSSPVESEEGMSRLSIGSAGSRSKFSRARILQQQRELQEKRRQQASSIPTGQTIRVNKDAVGLSLSALNSLDSPDGNFTPAVKQFSQPRNVEESVYSSFRGDGLGTPRSNTMSEFAVGQRPKSAMFLREEVDAETQRKEMDRRIANEENGNNDSRLGAAEKSSDKDLRTPEWPEAEPPQSRVFFDGLSATKEVKLDKEDQEVSELHRTAELQAATVPPSSAEPIPPADNSATLKVAMSDLEQNESASGKYDDSMSDKSQARGKKSKPRSGKAKKRSEKSRRKTEEESPERTEGAEVDESGSECGEGNAEDFEKILDDTQGAFPKPVRGAAPADPSFNPSALNLDDMHSFLTQACPLAAGVVQCYIKRKKSRGLKLYPEYELYMKEGDKFLLYSKKRSHSKTSHYSISMKCGENYRDSQYYLGKVRANFVGTEFQIFDDGMNPHDVHPGGEGRVRKEMGAVLYASNMLGNRGPRRMQVGIPLVTESGVIQHLPPNSKEDEIISRIKGHSESDIVYLINKPPRWNDQVGAYVLNFSGRVTMASVKNFQLVTPDAHDRIVVQFGRVAKDEFTLDFQWPISPFQAFALALSSFDGKICCD